MTGLEMRLQRADTATAMRDSPPRDRLLSVETTVGRYVDFDMT